MALATYVAPSKPQMLPREGAIMAESSRAHESLAFVGGCNPAEQLSISVQRSLLYDMSAVEAHARTFSDECFGRKGTLNSAGSLPALKENMEPVNERESCLGHAHVIDGEEVHATCNNPSSGSIPKYWELQDVCNALDSNVDALIKSFCDRGQHEEILQLLNYVSHGGPQPSLKTFANIFRVLSDNFTPGKGESFRFKSRVRLSTFIGNLLIRMYIKTGSPREARMVFDELVDKDIVTWNLMIGGYNQHNDDRQALELYHRMVRSGIQPNAITFLCVLKACSGMGALEEGKEVHLYTVESGLDSVMSVGATLIDMYAKCGKLEIAHTIFNRLPVRDLVTWTALISGYSNYGYSWEAVQIYDHLQGSGLKPDRIICVCVLRAYSEIAALDQGRDLHAYIIEKGFELNVTVSSALTEMYTKCSIFDDSSVTFSRLGRQDVVVWSVYMARLLEKGCYLEVLELFEKMQQACIRPDKVTFVSILKACSILTFLDHGKQVHSHVIGHGLELELSIGSALIDMYMKSGSLLDAQMVFQKLQEHDVVTWSSLTAGFVQHGQFEEALDLYLYMQQQGTKPNQVTFACILKACSSLLALHEGKQIHIQITQSGCEQNLFVANGLIDLYGKCGSVQDAQVVFEGMRVRDAVTWNAMIIAYATNDCACEAMQSFKHMSQAGFEPDEVSFIGALKACSSISALHQGKHTHSSIVGAGMESDKFVGSAIVAMYSKCGSLEHACTVFERCPNLDVVTWSAMITAYVHHGRYRHAFECFKEMQGAGIRPNDITFLCILSACARLGLISEGCLQFRMMKPDYGIEPTPEHFNALLDLFVHASRLAVAEDLLETVSVRLNTEGWTTLLSACEKHTNVALGRRCFDNLLQMDPRHGPGPAIMKNLYVCAGMHDEAEKIDSYRKGTRVWKKVAKAYVEVDEQVHMFTVGDTTHPKSNEIYQKLRHINVQKQSLDLDFREGAIAEAKDDKNCGHCERLAVAFGLLSTPQGATVRVSKNLKMCGNCHTATKAMSKIELREIVITDLYCVHHFKDGACSCEIGAPVLERL